MDKTKNEEIMDEFEKFLEDYETVQFVSTGINYAPGGFAEGEFIRISPEFDYIYFDLSWGVVTDTERTTHAKHLRIKIDDLMNKELGLRDKLNAVEII